LYPGSFDPPTFGHLDVIERGRRLFDRVVVGVGRNPDKRVLFTAEERAELLREQAQKMVEAEPNEAPVDVVTYDGLTVDCALANNCGILLRGVRNLSDLQYEVQQAVTNREVADLETAFVVAGQSFGYISSSLIRQITALSSDLSKLRSMCPPEVIDALEAKKRGEDKLLRRLAGEK
jgi:pantetheine-phosphate adenylyltransferase